MIGKTISHYKILEKLGEGGMGVVYKAQDLKLDRFVALKFLPPHLGTKEEEKERFIHEAKAASALDHPNICNIHEIDETEDGQVFIVMANYEGETLKRKIEKGPLKLDEALDIAKQISEGLNKSHGKGILHRDIKPANIFMTADGVVKILDFGLSKLAGRTKLTKTGTTLGTVAYMSPEQTRGEKVDHRTDIWSLGIILYEMITGQLPFKGDYEQAVVFSIVNEEPEPITGLRTGVPMELERIVNKAIEKIPGERYQHVDEILVDLRGVTGYVESRKIEREIPKPKRSRIRHLYLFGALIVILILMVIGRRYLFTGGAETIDSIAVLPLENLSGDEEQEYFVDGMTDALIGELARISALRVISRTSVMMYKGVHKPLPEIARELNVDAVIEGSVLRTDGRVRITAQLIQAEPEQHLWAKDYERDLKDILTLQRDLAQSMVKEINTKLTIQEEDVLKKVEEVNPEAHDAYLKGRYHVNQFSLESIKKAVYNYQYALEIDPDYASAHAGLAIATWFLHQPFGVLPLEEALAKAKALSLRAIELDERLGVAHYALAICKWYGEWEWDGAEKAFRLSIELDHNLSDARLIYPVFLGSLERYEEALFEIQQAMELDPFNLMLGTMKGEILCYADEYDRAIEEFKKILDLNPAYARAWGNLGATYNAKGMGDEAIASFKKWVSSVGINAEEFRIAERAYDEEGSKGYWRWWAERWKRVWETGSGPLLGRIGIGYANCGMKDEAFKWLERAFQEREGSTMFLKVNPNLDPLHSDPRFDDLVRRVGFPNN